MKRNFLSAAVMATIILGACANQKNATGSASGSGNAAAASGGNSVNYVKMHRTSCFGRCPSYSVEVFANGDVQYTGIRHVQDTGKYKKNIGSVSAKEILAQFTAHRVDTLKDRYEMMIADLPGINYSFRIGNEEKDVVNAHFGPEFLKTLAKSVDALVRTGETPVLDREWKKVTE